MFRIVAQGLMALSLSCLSFHAIADISPPEEDPCLADPTSRACGERAVGDIYVHEDYSKKIRTAEMVSPLGSDVFGEQVSLYNGATEFSAIDIDLPGNSDLPVQLRRRFSVDSKRGPQVLGGFGTWDIDVPYLYGVFDSVFKWGRQGDGNLDRCNHYNAQNNPAPWLPIIDNTFNLSDIWSGTKLSIPGEGEREMLYIRHDPGYVIPTTGGPYPWATRDDIRFTCKPTTTNGYPGEGFIAIDRNGTKYTLDVGIERGHGTLKTGNYATAPLGRARTRVYLMASRVEDRFGNYVNYTWVGEQLTRIEADDGRRIDITWSNGRIVSATAHQRTWSYDYDGTLGQPAVPWLRFVNLPDTSRYEYAFTGTLQPFYPQSDSGNSGYCPESFPANGGMAFTFTAKHPAGATGSFTFNYQRHYRGGVPTSSCAQSSSGWILGVSEYSDVYSLTQKAITGPGLPYLTWSYAYGGPSVVRTPNVLACTGTAADLIKATHVNQPDGSRLTHRFGVQHACNDGRLMGVTTYADAGLTTLKTETHTYVTEAEAPSMPFKDVYGIASGSEDPSTSRIRPIKSTLINQQSVNFGSTVNAFNNFAQPIDVTKASLYGNKREYTSYYNALGKWVIGQLYNIRVQKDGVDTWPLGRLFDSVAHLPSQNYAFGKLVDARTYHNNGRLLTISDPGAVKKTMFQQYKRGIPQTVTYHDGSVETAVVSDRGEITSVTDPLGSTTSYGYDFMGRLNAITYPAGDSTAWTPTSIAFENVAGIEYGLPANHWRQTISTGNARKITYFDGLWRPVLTREYDTANETGTRRMVQRRFDHANRETLVSYPQQTIATYNSGVNSVTTQYDALGRPTLQQANAEAPLGILSTSYNYISLFRTQVTDPKGNITTTRYQAFDQPTTDAPTLVQTSAGTSTTITRDIFDKPTHIQRSGLWNGSTLFADRRFVYDDNQRLCKTYDPEAGWTVMDYDASNNIAWTSTGLTSGVNSVSLCQREAVAAGDKSSRSYDDRNRLLTIIHPDIPVPATDDITHTYFADGALKTISTTNGGTWTYAYNKRRLMTSESLAINGFNLTVGHAYTVNGHHSSTQYPDGSAVNAFPNALGEPIQAGSYVTNVTYHPNGAVAGFSYGNGIVHSQTLNIRQLPLLRRETYPTPSATFMHYTHAYDGNANLTQRLDGDSSDGVVENRTMVYDGLDRLITANATGTGTLGLEAYTYDPLDNLRTVNFGFQRAELHTYDYNSKNQLSQRHLTDGQGNVFIPYSYDARGNMTIRGTTIHTYDRANRMVSANTPSGNETYRYDGHGRRTTITRAGGTTLQLYTRDGKLIYERSPSGTVTKHIHLGNRLVATNTLGTTVYQHTDHLGSVVRRTNGSRVTISGGSTFYGPYGSQFGGSTYEQRPAFTGHMSEKLTTLTYMQQRYYDPLAMRFVSVDPIGASASGSNFNRYWYANNNPYKYADPDGREIKALNAVQQNRIEKEINSQTNIEFRFDNNNSLKEVEGPSVNAANGSPSYSKAVSDAISSETVVSIGIQQRYRDSSGQRGSIDRDHSGGLTGKVSSGDIIVLISGNSLPTKDIAGNSIIDTPSDILRHEIVGHAAPQSRGQTRGNAIVNDNITRGELGKALLPSDSKHTESQ